MASTYSNYKIELITTGEQPGTWGTTTNNNFQYAIEQAIGGYVSIPYTTSLALTDTNALQNARALFLNITGSPGADATITLPSIQKLYFIKNALSTTYNLLVKTATATTLTVPYGKTACIYVNGTDVVGTSDWLPSLTTTTITASGTATLNGNFSAGTSAITSGTYGRSANTVTVDTSPTAHGFSNGQILYLSFSAGTGGTATSGVYTISGVTTNTFTVTDTASGTITGSPAVSITKYNNTITLNAPVSVFGSAGTAGQVLVSQGDGVPPVWSTVTSVAGNWTVGGNFAVTGTSTFTGAATFNGNTTVGSTTVNSGSATMTTSAGVSFTITGNSGNVYSLAATDVVYIVTVGGSVPTGFYTVASVTGTSPNVTAFTCNYSGATASAGTVTSVTKYNNTANLQAPLSSFGSVGTSGFVLTSQGSGAPPQWAGVSSFVNSGTKLSVDSSGNFTSVIPSDSSLTPTFFTRAWVNFSGASYTTVSGTYTWSGSTCTVTKTAHGLLTGDVVYLNFTAGAAAVNAARIFYTVTKTGDDTFTVSGGTYTQATAAAVSWYTAPISGSGNVRLVSVGTPGAAIGIVQAFSIMFTTPIFDANYAWTACAGQDNEANTAFISSPTSTAKTFWKKAGVLYLGIYESAGTKNTTAVEDISVVVTR